MKNKIKSLLITITIIGVSIMSEATMQNRLHFQVQSAGKTYEEQYPYQVGTDDDHLAIYPEITPALRSTAPETLTDSNCYFVDSQSGHDGDESPAGDGSEANPYRTLDYTITQLFAQGSRTIKYICILDTAIFVEDIQIPEWLDGNIFADDDSSPAVTPTIRRIERTIPDGLTDNNSKWVDLAVSSGGDGTESDPYGSIQEALDDIITEADASPSDINFIYVPVRVYDANYELTENITFLASSNVTQEITIFPYILDNSTHKPGKELILKPDLDQSPTAEGSTYENAQKIAQFTTRNFVSGNKDHFFMLNTNGKVEYTHDFKSFSNFTYSDGDITHKGLAEYYYNGHWYIFSFTATTPSGTYPTFATYRDDGTNSSSTVLAQFPISSSNYYDVVSDSNKLCFAFVDDNDKLTAGTIQFGTDPTNAAFTNSINFIAYLIDISSPNSYLQKIAEDEFVLINGYNMYYYTNGQTTTYTLGHPASNFFKINGKYYYIYGDKIYNYSLLDKTSIEYMTIPTSYTFETTYIYEDKVYILFQSSTNQEMYIFNGDTVAKILDGSSVALDMYDRHNNAIFKGFAMMYYGAAGTNIYYANISQFVSFGRTILQGIKIDGDQIGACYTTGIDESDHGGGAKWCHFTDNHVGYHSKENLDDDIDCCIFTDCDYPLIVENEGGAVDRTVFDTFTTAIDFRPGSSLTDGMDCSLLTAYSGKNFYIASARSGSTASEFDDCIITQVGIAVNSSETEPVELNNCIIYPYATSVNTTEDADCVDTIPIFVDAANGDFRLQCPELGYQFNSAGRESSSTSYSVIGKDYEWASYSNETGDIGAMTVLAPVYRNRQWEDMEFTYTPSTMSEIIQQKNSTILISLQGSTYKNEPTIKWNYDFGFGSTQAFDRKHIIKLKRLALQTDPFKMFLNGQYDLEKASILGTETSWADSQLYDKITNGLTGWRSGTWTLSGSGTTVSTGLTVEEDQYNGLFLVIYDPSNPWDRTVDKYELRITSTTSAGVLTLENYWDITLPADGSYEMVIAYRAVLMPVKDITSRQEPFVGFNEVAAITSKLMSGQSISFIEV
jgi:hypothetical protein